MENNNEFIQKNSPDGGFLQSEEWRKFQEAAGRRTFNISGDNFWANVIEHQLPIVGKYFYIPRGPILENPKSEIRNPKQIQNSKSEMQNFSNEIINLAKKENAGWIRIDPASEEILEIIKDNVGNAQVHSESRNAYMRSLQKYKITKAPHDMQPKEIFVIDITKSEEILLAEMKSKARYNIKVAQKHGVSARAIINQNTNHNIQNSNKTQIIKTQSTKYFDEFIRLVKVTAERDRITPHPENYYRQMFETIPPENLKLYIAEYEGKIVAANIVIFYGNTATYLHGASDNDFRNVMAPYLLQWQQILDAKKAGLMKYDFGGVKSAKQSDLVPTLSLIRRGSKGEVNSWFGITRFKTGFSPETKPTEFPGSYDIIVNPVKYNLYKTIQKIKSLL